MSAPQPPSSPETPAFPKMNAPRPLGLDWTLVGSWAPIGDIGALPVNSFLFRGAEPMLVDTNLAAVGDDFMAALESEIDLADLRWIWLSHMDADHIGNLRRVLAKATSATVITNFLGLAKLQLIDLVPERLRLIAHGDTVEIGGRRLTAMRPVYYDAPETMSFHDEAGALFVADSFGALFPGVVDRLEDASEAALREGMFAWSQIDAPWLGDQSAEALGRKLDDVARIEPKVIMSAHLPPATSSMRRLTGIVGRAYKALRPFGAGRLAA